MAKKPPEHVKHSLLTQDPGDLLEAKEALRDRLFAPDHKGAIEALSARKAKRFHPSPTINVVGVGIGEKVTEGTRTGEMCVKVMVAKKFPKDKIGRQEMIPPAINGIPTDVQGVGYPVKFEIPQRRRSRPVTGGVSVGLDLNAVNFRFAGTLGSVVADRQNLSRLFALSNNHVFADENRAAGGSGVVQPGTLDGGTNADRVASLAQFVPLKFDNRRNWMDAAIAEFSNPATVDRSILGIGTPSGAGRPTLGLLVRKSGRTTGLTEGVVRAVNFDVRNVQYDQGFVRVDDVVVIEGIDGPFSAAGDSGSAILDHQGKVVALLFAGSPAVTFGIPIRRVLRRFGVQVAS